MPLWTWFITLIRGFLPVDGKRIGKIIWLGIWIILALTIYHKIFFTKQNVTNIEKIEKQIINQGCPDPAIAGIKINLWKLKLSLGI